jgi:hypothetical protein
VRPSIPVVGQLPSASLPGTTIGGSSAGGGAKPPAGSTTPAPTASGSRPAGSTSGGVNNPPGQSVEDKTVPKGYGCCDEGSHPSAGGANCALINQLGGRPDPARTDGPTYAAGNNPPFGSPAPTRTGQPINLAANKAPAAQSRWCSPSWPSSRCLW